MSKGNLIRCNWTTGYPSSPLNMGWCPGNIPSSPMVGTSPFSAEAVGLIPALRTKIPHVSWPKQTNKQTKKPQNIKQKQYCNKFNKDFKNGPHQKKRKKLSMYGRRGQFQQGNLAKAVELSRKLLSRSITQFRRERRMSGKSEHGEWRAFTS